MCSNAIHSAQHRVCQPEEFHKHKQLTVGSLEPLKYSLDLNLQLFCLCLPGCTPCLQLIQLQAACYFIRCWWPAFQMTSPNVGPGFEMSYTKPAASNRAILQATLQQFCWEQNRLLEASKFFAA